ncbi:MAG: GrpB family protein [Alphaproteobacteria bacterium]|nr:MAG: GrpB family protein [Alphaproteobacteria bacterium]
MITIVPYKPEWSSEFDGIGAELRQFLGEFALRIDHIGSTAVPGLAAKDIIDVQITVQALLPALEEALAQAGYKRLAHILQDHVPPGGTTDIAEWTKWFFKPVAPESRINVHVRLLGRANQRYPLLFRDYLRSHSAIAEAYGQVKQALVAHSLDDPDAYYDVKDPVCDIIIGGAEEWVMRTGWTLGSSAC